MYHLSKYIKTKLLALSLALSMLASAQSSTITVEKGSFRITGDISNADAEYFADILSAAFIDAHPWTCDYPQTDPQALTCLILRLFSDTCFSAPIVKTYSDMYFRDYLPYVLITCINNRYKEHLVDLLMKNNNSLWFMACWDSPWCFDLSQYRRFLRKQEKAANIGNILDLFVMAHNSHREGEKCVLRKKLEKLGVTIAPDSVLPVDIDYLYEPSSILE